MNDSDSTKHYLYMQDKMGLDCSAYAVTHQFERKHYMRYSQPFQPCVTPRQSCSIARGDL